VKSEIDKNVDQLHEYEDHRDFLKDIFAKENSRWTEDQERLRLKKIQKEKKRWIEFAKLHKDQVAEEDRLLAEFIKAQDNQPGIQGVKPKKSKEKQSLSDKELEAKFEEMLGQELIDVGEDFYEEGILYSEVRQLMDNFSYLEDQNLKNISKTQEIEEAIEKMIQQEKRIKSVIGGEIEVQRQVKRDLEN
jgi:hypothetical protein